MRGQRERNESSHSAERFTFTEVMAVAAVLSGAFMVVLDFFIVIVALPAIQSELGATHAMLGLIVAAYAAATASGLVAGGRLGDMFGRKKVLLIGLAFFTAASLGCGLAQSTAMLIGMRVLQGLAAALVQPQVLALLGSSFAGAKRVKVFAWYAIAMGLAGVTAQLIGALVIETAPLGLGWRGCFLINLPIGLLGLALAWHAVSETDKRSDMSLDPVGTTLVAATLGMLVLALTHGRESGWPAWSIAFLGAAGICAIVFARHENRMGRSGGMPMVPGQLLRSRGFGIGMLAVFVFYAGVASFYFVLGLHLQQGLGLKPVASGLMFAMLGSAFLVCTLFGARISRRLKNLAMFAGASLMAAGHAWQLGVDWCGIGVAWIVPGLLAQGAGIGLVMAPLVAAVLAAAPAKHAGVASGVVTTVQQVGNALGVALISAVFALGPLKPAPAAAISGFSLSMFYLIAACAALGAVLWRARGEWQSSR